VKNIEDEVFNAIIKAGGVAETNQDMRKVSWHRTSRTDKGVHAILNVMSLKFLLEPGIIDSINENLPSDIHAYGYKRVTSSFNPKNMCNSRQYEYLIPTFALKPDPNRECDINAEKLTLEQLNETTFDISYRIDPTLVARMREVLSHFVGTHNYRNFTTKGKLAQNAGTIRYIKEFTCSDPLIIDDVEIVAVRVLGQSFIYNQIRKMIGFAICIMRGYVDEADFKTAFDPDWFYETPTAPGQGLMLDMLFFEGYNKKHGRIHGNLHFDDYGDQIKRFKIQVFQGIVKLEKEKQM
jgi:tRNA pseudouridine38-40 synthase